MGKVRRQRSQFHYTPIDPRSGTKQRNDDDISSLIQSQGQLDTVSLPGNLFNNLNIDHKLLAQRLPDFDTRSNVTSRTFKGLNLKKKDKLKIRHELFMQKINQGKFEGLKRRRKGKIRYMDIFKQVMSHPSFIENPTGTITEHLHNKLKQEEEMDS